LVRVEATGRRAATRARLAALWLPDATGAVRAEPAGEPGGELVPLHRVG
jgi:hypothetical protein